MKKGKLFVVMTAIVMVLGMGSPIYGSIISGVVFEEINLSSNPTFESIVFCRLSFALF